MDFTINQYTQLLKSLQNAGFFFQTFAQYSESPHRNVLVLRHNVDARPQNSLRFAQIQAEHGVVGTYYFRAVPQSYDEDIIREIAEFGHEIGYHYETMDTCKGDVDSAYEVFCRNLEKFRKLTEIKTISMHGSPLSTHDNRDIWQKYDYRKLGILAEPYFDINFNELFYLTDTGRRWDGWKVSIRDKIPQQEEWIKKGLVFSSTKEIIKAAEDGKLPEKIMMTFHPQRWNDKFIPWMKELVLQNIKNVGKRVLVKMRG